jgi:hypothetical protein
MTVLARVSEAAAVILSGAKDLLPVRGQPPPALHAEQSSAAPQTLSTKYELSSSTPAAHYLRRPTTVSTRLFRNQATIPSVRYYTTKRVQGGMRFTCVRCEHSVSTLDFDTRDGNLRTQAATALNQHASKAHNQPVMYSSLDPQQRIWRA